MNLRKPVPGWLALCLVLFSTSVAVAAATSITSVNFIKPYLTGISFTSTQLKIEGAKLSGYNVSSQIYSTCVVTVKNYYLSGVASGTVQVSLFSSTGAVIASGSALSPAIAAGASTDVSVALTWAVGKTINDASSGQISVSES